MYTHIDTDKKKAVDRNASATNIEPLSPHFFAVKLSPSTRMEKEKTNTAFYGEWEMQYFFVFIEIKKNTMNGI